MPGNIVHNGYTSARALFDALSQAGTGNSHAVIRELESMRFSAAQRLQHEEARMDPATHSLQQAVYLATANPEPRHSEDLFRLLAWTGPDKIVTPGSRWLLPGTVRRHAGVGRLISPKVDESHFATVPFAPMSMPHRRGPFGAVSRRM